MTYLIPERYFGREIGPSADQYYLGLLALELLHGTPPVQVRMFVDLETKRKFFDDPRSFFGNLSNEHPALSFILAKMLEKDPKDRWTSMSELADSLRDVASGTVPKAIKKCVAEQYKSKLRNNMPFFDQFYRRLFEWSEEIGKIFERRGVRMGEQHKKLAAAVQSVLLFDRGLEVTTLDQEAERHLEFGIKAEHFELFITAFLESLCTAKIEDGYSHDAWRAILHPALAFMKERATTSPTIAER
jgi:hemoglobin-like flavoprotein